MKKVFLRSIIVLLSLFIGFPLVYGSSLGNLPPEIQEMMNANAVYHAQLTGHASSTGGGKVYVTTAAGDPRSEAYVEGTSNVAVNHGALSIQGMDVSKVYIYAWAKPEPGYYLLGWSFSNGDIDLGLGEYDENSKPIYEFIHQYDVAEQQNETAQYVIYATFEPIRLADYTISGNNTAEDNGSNQKVCTQTVVVTPAGDNVEETDFKTPVFDPADSKWTVTAWDYNTTNAGKLTIVVTFSVDASSAAAEYSANLKVSTQADVAINVPLNARTIAPGVEAILYTKKKDYKDKGTLTAMLAEAAETDIVALNRDYAANVTLDKNISFDLNGFTLTGALTSTAAKGVLAYSPYGGTVEGAVTVSAGQLTLTGGTINGVVTVEEDAALVQSGATINVNSGAAITSNGTLTTTDGVVTGETYAIDAQQGTININGGSFTAQVAVNVAAGVTANINKGNLTGVGANSYGVQSAGTTTVEKLAVISGVTKALNIKAGTTQVKCGKFTDPHDMFTVTGSGTLTFVSAYFLRNDGQAENVQGKQLWRNTAGAEFREGYNFFAGDVTAAKAEGVSVCHIGSTSYSSLEDAFAYANNTDNEITIVMDNDYVLPEGHYTLPANATLLVPMDNLQGAGSEVVNRVASTSESDWEEHHPTRFRTLTLESGVNIDVHGTIEVSGSQFSSNQAFTGAPYGPYGMIQMRAGSKMVLQNGSLLRAWGFVTGDIDHKDSQYNVPTGEIDARRGSKVMELFQMGDWKGATFSGGGLLAGDSIFPLTDYFIQNIEAPVKYHPGAKLSATTTVHEGALGIVMSANDIQVIGVVDQDVAMFLMDANADAENTWVRKWYDASKDQQVYEVNSGAHIGRLVIPLMSSPLLPMVTDLKFGSNTIGELLKNMVGAPVTFGESFTMNSGQYFLPITSNFKIHLLSGMMDFTQSTALLPGAEVEIEKEAEVTIDPRDENDDRKEIKRGTLFVYDWRDWGNYARGQVARLVKYSPTFDAAPNTRDVDDAEKLGSANLNVHGTFNTNGGYVLTTEHGGNIFSTEEDAGTFVFAVPTQPKGYYEEILQYDGGRQTTICYPVWLRNNNNPRPTETDSAANAANYVQTAGEVAAGGESYCYLDIDGTGAKWTKLQQKGCFVYDAANDVYYAKPQEYVAIIATDHTTPAQEAEGVYDIRGNEESHTYSDAAGTGRLFILMEDECQWWEVENVDNLYHCIHPENDTYYFWDVNRTKFDEDEGKDVPAPGWVEKKFTITWKDKDWANDPKADVVLATYEVPYGTQAEWLSTNPIRPKNLDYTYNFIGWTPALGKVTQDVTYTATYEENQIKYTVVFLQDGGVEIERHLLARDEMPVCENTPTRTGYILQWEPAIEPVVGNKEYTATWLPLPPETYTITFKNYNGDVLQSGPVEADTEPTPPADDPTKLGTTEYEYTFAGWKPAIGPATTNLTYVAQYTATPKTYDIKFFKEDGTTQIGATQSLAYGATPTVPTGVTPASPQEGYSYILEWENIATGGKSVEAVTRAADYKAVFTGVKNKYTVTLKTNDAAHCTLTGAGIYDYNTSIPIHANVKSGYKFVGWLGTSETDAEFSHTVTEDITLTALIEREDPSYRRTVSNNIGTLCIPFDIPADGIEGAVFYQLSGKDENGKLVFDEVTSLQAGHPYIFQAYASEIKLYGSANNADLVTVNQMAGSYSTFPLPIDETNKHQVVYIANNKFWFCDDLVEQGFLEVVANRCYILNYSAIGSAPNPAPARRRVVLGTNGTNIATDIDNVNGDEVQGTTVRKVLIDNMLYIQRGEKMYNVEGQMVR